MSVGVVLFNKQSVRLTFVSMTSLPQVYTQQKPGQPTIFLSTTKSLWNRPRHVKMRSMLLASKQR